MKYSFNLLGSNLPVVKLAIPYIAILILSTARDGIRSGTDREQTDIVSVRSDCFYNIIDQFSGIISVDPEHTSVPVGN